MKTRILLVARIKLPKQDAYCEARQEYVEALSFSVAHCLEDFRPLNFIMRVRLQAYPQVAHIRRQGNGEPFEESTSVARVHAELLLTERVLS